MCSDVHDAGYGIGTLIIHFAFCSPSAPLLLPFCSPSCAAARSTQPFWVLHSIQREALAATRLLPRCYPSQSCLAQQQVQLLGRSM